MSLGSRPRVCQSVSRVTVRVVVTNTPNIHIFDCFEFISAKIRVNIVYNSPALQIVFMKTIVIECGIK